MDFSSISIVPRVNDSSHGILFGFSMILWRQYCKKARERRGK